jgi:hypothetical protein
LTGVAPYLPEPLLADVLAAARDISYESVRATALTELVDLPEPLLADVLTAARDITNEVSRARCWASLPHISVDHAESTSSRNSTRRISRSTFYSISRWRIAA